MATPKKKHLIELMIEAGVKWPDGAEYAAQDKRDTKLSFYRLKPYLRAGSDSWVVKGYIGRSRVDLPLLCRNWHQTIVTREQYAEAVAPIPMTPAAQQETQPDGEWEPVEWGNWKVGDTVRFDGFTNELHKHWSFDVGVLYVIGKHNEPIAGNGQQPSCNWGFSFSRRKKQETQPSPEYCASVMRQMPDNTIEQLTADYHAKAAEADRLQAAADDALKAADDALLALEKAGELIGLVISIDTKPKRVGQPVEPEQPAITDWRDLRAGDVIWWEGDAKIFSGEYTVESIERADYTGDCVIFLSSKEWVDVSCQEWRFIRRP